MFGLEEVMRTYQPHRKLAPIPPSMSSRDQAVAQHVIPYTLGWQSLPSPYVPGGGGQFSIRYLA